MKEDFIIRIKSRTEQFDHMQPVRTGEDDRIEIMTYGSLVKKGDTYYITYKETQTIGFEGCTTTIKIAADGSRVARPTPSSSSSGTAATSATMKRRSAA